MNDDILLRVQPNDRNTWAFYPEMEDRALNFATERLHYTPAQIGGLKQELRNRFATDGALYLLLIRGEKTVGHLLAWILFEWSQPHLFVYQAEMDEALGAEMKGRVLGHINGYVAWANSMYEKMKQAHRITDVRLQTGSKAMARYLDAVGADEERVVLKWTVA